MGTPRERLRLVTDVVAVLAGRLALAALRVVRPGGGTAIPGRVAVRISPGLIARILSRPRLGLVVVSGSSGKSTTAALVRAILEGHGLRVLANRRTANIPHGIAAELITEVDVLARTRADVAVMEVDEGYAAAIATAARARVVVLLNVMIDQLHRWQEPEVVAQYLERAAAAATETLVVNGDDAHLARVAQDADERGISVRRFGMSPVASAALLHSAGSAPDFGRTAEPGAGVPARPPVALVESVDADRAVIRTASSAAPVTLPGRGMHVAMNVAAALEAAAAVLGDRYDDGVARAAVEGATTVFGRQELIATGGAELELILTKSPASMQVNLDLLEPEPRPTMVAVGRDIFDSSQLWLADWRTLGRVDVVSGWQAWDAALRLAYDEVGIGKVDGDLDRAVRDFVSAPLPVGERRRIVMTPESMRVIRRCLRLDRRRRS